MNGFELNKIAAAILLSGVIAMIVSIVTEQLYHGAPHHGEEVEVKRGYTIEGAETAGETGTAAVATGPVDIAPYLSAADPKAGEALVKRCTSCHTFEKGGLNRQGPNQYGLVGRAVGSHEGFSYSEAMKSHGGNWTFQELSEFLENPKKKVPGTAMVFAGLKKPEERAALLTYLNTLSDSPLPIPKVDFPAAPAPDAAAPAAPAAPDAKKPVAAPAPSH